MTLGTFLLDAQKQLEGAGIPSARLDAMLLICEQLKKDKAWLLAHPNAELTPAELSPLRSQIKRRLNHEPLAYILGKSEFYGREFLVTSDTLQPRPETETMIELLLSLAESRRLKVESILDVGTGSGCIAITAKLELPNADVHATDISEKCLKVAKNNTHNLDADVKFYQGNLLTPLPSTVYQLPTTILANLPYVPDEHTINQAAMHEPKLAIFGGKDGLDCYRQLFAQISKRTMIEYVLTESLPPQHGTLKLLAEEHGFKQKLSQDFIQVFAKV